MLRTLTNAGFAASLAALLVATTAGQQQDSRLAGLKQEVTKDIDARFAATKQMIDMVFSFGELGYQEVETSKYLTSVLEKNGFRIERNVGGLPTGWVARGGSGRPVIALGADIDGIPQGSQKPGVGYHDAIVEGAPGHVEGHNAGTPLNITAALAAKRVMDGLISVQYEFHGEPAHAGSAPWRGKSALDAVELMDIGWNFRREHLRISQRSHNVIPDGGFRPNVVPESATTWYYLRETDSAHIKELHSIADRMAEAAAMMTDTRVTSRVIGTSWPQHFNKPVAEAMSANITATGMPTWDERDVILAKGIQKELKQPEIGLETKTRELQESVPLDQNTGGGSDDIGDVSWTAPTILLRYPANIPNLPGHHWANAISMATPIAHKGTIAGAKAQAMTVLDLVLRPDLIEAAKAFF